MWIQIGDLEISIPDPERGSGYFGDHPLDHPQLRVLFFFSLPMKKFEIIFLQKNFNFEVLTYRVLVFLSVMQWFYCSPRRAWYLVTFYHFLFQVGFAWSVSMSGTCLRLIQSCTPVREQTRAADVNSGFEKALGPRILLTLTQDLFAVFIRKRFIF